MYFLNRLKKEYSSDENGIKPNDEFNKKFGNLFTIYNS